MESVDALLIEADALYRPYKAHQDRGRMDAPPAFHNWMNWLVDEDGGERLFLALRELQFRMAGLEK